jgi:outer membrane protein TolC
MSKAISFSVYKKKLLEKRRFMMFGKKVIWILSVLVIIISVSMAQEQEQKELTLDECIFHAIKNNLDVTAELLSPELANISVSQAREKFIPVLGFTYNRSSTNSASYSWIELTETLSTQYKNYQVEIGQAFPTGGEFYVALNSNKYDTNQRLTTINPRYGSTLTFNFIQPLLRNFGFKISRMEILVAKNNRDISENDLKNALLETVLAVEQAYWNLVFSIETLEVRRESLKLAEDLLEKNRKEIEIGTMAPKEILSSQAEVAHRQADILQAKSAVKNNVDMLKVLINLPDDEGEIDIVPLDKPSFEQREVNLNDALRTAWYSRPDLQSSRIIVKNRDLDLTFAKNQLLPTLNLNASYWSPGLSGNQILLDPLNPFNPPIGEIPGSSADALRDALDFRYDNWSLYLTLDIPLNTVISRAAQAHARVSREQSEVRLKSLEQKIILEVKTAVRAVETDYQRAEAYKLARELAEQKLEAEEAKLDAGLSTNFVVLQYQRDLSNARSNELRAIVDYNLSLSQLDKTLGISLQNRNIKTSDLKP